MSMVYPKVVLGQFLCSYILSKCCCNINNNILSYFVFQAHAQNYSEAWLQIIMEELHKVSGLIVPHFITQDEVDRLKDFPLRPDDVWVVAYPKAGTTWTQQIVRLIRHGGKDDGKVLSESVPWLEALSHMYPHLKVDELPLPRTFQSHFKYDIMPCGLPSETPCKYIYVARNPKDLAVSYYHHHRGFKQLHRVEAEWESFLEMFASGQIHFGDYFDHVLSWWTHRSDDNVLFLKYEDMKKDLPSAVSQIAKFIGQELSSEVLDEITRKTIFAAMKDDPKANHSWTAHLRESTAEPFMRRGVVGDWRNMFTEEQSRRLDLLYESQFVPAGLELEFLPD